MPSISWYRDGVQLNTSESIGIDINSTVNSTHIESILTINPVAIDDDGAVYVCTASNTLPDGIYAHSIFFTLDITRK